MKTFIYWCQESRVLGFTYSSKFARRQHVLCWLCIDLGIEFKPQSRQLKLF